jgi:hypothetical protein
VASSSEAIKEAQTDPAARKALLDFCAAPGGDREAGINVLYLDAYGEEIWPQFLADAHERGMKLEYIVDGLAQTTTPMPRRSR